MNASIDRAASSSTPTGPGAVVKQLHQLTSSERNGRMSCGLCDDVLHGRVTMEEMKHVMVGGSARIKRCIGIREFNNKVQR
jgi:hypothetical protein